MNTAEKIAIGTVQFGLKYGVNNTGGKVSESEAFAILDEAAQSGITTLDTAALYGDSEEVIGRYNAERGEQFSIVSKLPYCSAVEIPEAFEHSLQRLHTEKLYGYLFHSYEQFTAEPQAWSYMRTLRDAGRIARIGFSLYHPQQLEYLIDELPDLGIVQIPFSVFDRRFSELLPVLHERGIEVHVRSVFLQGLVFRSPDNLHPYFSPVREKLAELQHIALDSGLSVAALCLGFALANPSIDRVVIGVDSVENLRENISELLRPDQIQDYMNRLGQLREADENMILPTHWKLA